MDYRKEVISAITKNNLSDWITNNGSSVRKRDLIALIVELDYIRHKYVESSTNKILIANLMEAWGNPFENA